jgi:SAM-dependent methyltransferase
MGFSLGAASLLARFRKTEPIVGAERPADWYDERFATNSTYQTRYQDSPYYFLWAVITDRLRRDGVKQVLEIGCGTGQLAAFLLDQGIEDYVGLDFSPTAVEYARKAAPEGRFIVGDARTSTVYADERYEALICTEVLEHIAGDRDVVARFPSGTRCLFSVPNYTSAGHVRYFGDVAAVRERYEPFFSSLDVVEFGIARSTVNRLFLGDGYRNRSGSHS